MGLRPSANPWVDWVTLGEIGWTRGVGGGGGVYRTGLLKPQALTFRERENQPNIPLKITLNQTRYRETSRGSLP